MYTLIKLIMVQLLFYILIPGLHNPAVTKNTKIRYNIQTVMSNIINNKFSDIISIWKSKIIILTNFDLQNTTNINTN